MRCTKPRTVGFKSDGKTIAWSPRTISKEFAEFQLPCGKCIDCKLEYARQWAVRCVHESMMHPQNAFITLTYDDQHLPGPTLVYADFQRFMKRLRAKFPTQKIGYMCVGEYGENDKRPHWHAIIFNWAPPDPVYFYTNKHGDKVYKSEELDSLWGNGFSEFGSVTFKSAGYVARYSAKALVHGRPGEHKYEPISKKSNHQAIGKSWLETHWRDCFSYGTVVLPDGTACGTIPRYYERWLMKHKPDEWKSYVTQLKAEKSRKMSIIAATEKASLREINSQRRDRMGLSATDVVTKEQARAEITKSKFNQLQKALKL